ATKSGAALLKLGRFREARIRLEEQRATMETLLKRRPAHKRMSELLAVCDDHLAAVAFATGDLAAASRHAAAHLSTGQRLALFVTVCQAVQHAHQKGIIHRDIKASNVLVTLEAGKPVPKVIDFGVAKAISPDRANLTEVTSIFQLIGTPLYMSPEQAELGNPDIDTRSDVYSLGVLLYELLSGRTPFDKQRLKQASFDEMRRIIREEEPPRPSQCPVKNSTPHAPREESGSRSEPATWAKLLRGELDWIVMKALEKDRSGRYESASALAADVQRYLDDEPIQAAPPSRLYQAGKYIRRHKLTVSIALLTFSLLALGLATTGWQAYRARKAEQSAEERFEIASDAVNKYLLEVTSDEQLASPAFQDLRRRLLESAEPFLDRLSKERPKDSRQKAKKAAALHSLGKVLVETGKYPLAHQAFERATELYEELVNAEPQSTDNLLELTRVLQARGYLLWWQRKGNEAIPYYQRTLALRKTLQAGVPSDPGLRHELAIAHFRLGSVQGDKEGCRSFAEAARILSELCSEHPTVDAYHDSLALTHQQWAFKLESDSQPAAREKHDTAIGIFSRLSAANPDSVRFSIALAVAQTHLGDTLHRFLHLEESRKCRDQARERLTNLATKSPGRADVEYQLGRITHLLGDNERDLWLRDTPYSPFTLESVKRRYQDALAIQERLRAKYPHVANFQVGHASTQVRIGEILYIEGKTEDAIHLLRDSIGQLSQVQGRTEGQVNAYDYLADSHAFLAEIYASEGRSREANQAQLEARKYEVSVEKLAVWPRKVRRAMAWEEFRKLLRQTGGFIATMSRGDFVRDLSPRKLLSSFQDVAMKRLAALMRLPQVGRSPFNKPRLRARRLFLEQLERRSLLAGFAFLDFSDTSSLTLLDNPLVTSDLALRIAPADVTARGNVWFSEKHFVSLGFETVFDFRMTGGGNSGLAFVVQNEVADALGRQGPLGYAMIANSLAVEFDTFLDINSGDPNDNHVGVNTGGVDYNSPRAAYSLGSASPAADLNDGAVHTARIAYVPGSLSIYVDDLATPLLTVAVDLAETLDLDLGRAWVGFTATSGNQDHDILNWQYQTLVDTTQAVGITDVTQAEGNTGTTILSFLVSRLGDTSGSTNVLWSTSNGTAGEGNDYTASSGQVSFGPGENQKVIDVAIHGDASQEPNETFFVNLMLQSGAAVVSDGKAQGTILNDDVSISISDATPIEGSAAWRFVDNFIQPVTSTLVQPLNSVFGPDGNLYVGSRSTDDVQRFDGSTGAFLGVFANTVPGFMDDPRQMVFGPDGNLYVCSFDGTVRRYNGTTGAYMDNFVATGSGGLDNSNGIAFGPDGNLYVGNRHDNQILRYNGSTGAFIDAFIPAGQGLQGAFDFVFRGDGKLYVANTGANEILRFDSLTGVPLGAFVPSNIGVLNSPVDLLFGPDGDLYVSSNGSSEVSRFHGTTGAFIEIVASPSNGGLSRAQGLSFDAGGLLYVIGQTAAPDQNLTADDPVLRYGAGSLAVFTVSLSTAAGSPVTVSYATANGAASAGSDYANFSGTLTFAPGETTKTVLIKTLNDTANEGNEAFVVNLSNPVGGVIVDGQGVATIQDDEASRQITIGDVTVTEGGSAVFTVQLSSSSGLPVTVQYATANATAVAGSDFTTASGVLTFAAGQTSQTITVNTVNDTTYESTETFVVNLSNPFGGVIADSQGVGTILDNDPQPTKFYVVDDATANKTYEYGATGTAVENYSLNSGNAAPRGAASTVAGDKTWVVDANKNVYVYNTSGGLLGSWTAGSQASNATVEGIA
ncbi:MAG: protein kinase, partial [Pirellulaceae bacterium]|nr:protein kinase [Pirellulaceae bacterium]